MRPSHVGGGKGLIRLAIGEAAPAAVEPERAHAAVAVVPLRVEHVWIVHRAPGYATRAEERGVEAAEHVRRSRLQQEAVRRRPRPLDRCLPAWVGGVLRGRLRRVGAKDYGGRTIAIPLVTARYADLVLAGGLPGDPPA